MIRMSEQEFIRIVDFIQGNYGLDLRNKRHLIEGRLSNLIEEMGYGSFDAYFSHVIKDRSGMDMIDLINRLTTNHTFFMREPGHFGLFESTVLPWIEEEAGDQDVRIWCAGCSTGEEPYTLAMILQDYFGERDGKWDKKLLATDINAEVLGRAQDGIYGKDAVEGLKESWRRRYFTRINAAEYQVKEPLRDEIIFRRFNLMDDFPFRRKFHAIFCRNVMIYFNQDTKNRLIQKFYESTETGGYLFIGMAESAAKDRMPYDYVMPSVYRKG